MQINEIIRDIQAGTTETATKRLGEGIQQKEIGQDVSIGPLKEMQMDRPFYNKENLMDEVERKVGTAENQVSLVKTQMVLAASTMSSADLREIEEQGFSAKDLDPESFTTIADKIKLQLAKAGVDISIMGGLDREQIAAMSGDTYATMMENALEQADLPTTPEVVEDGVVGLQKMVEMQETPSEDIDQKQVSQYLLKNEEPATIANVYRAMFAGNADYTMGVQQASMEEEMEVPEGIRTQMENIVTAAGYGPDEQQLMLATELFQNEIPVTVENIQYANALQQMTLPENTEDVLQIMVDAVMEGKMPQEATLIPGQSLMDQARTAVSEIQTMEVDASDVSNYRALEELRLSMTVTASFTLLKSGITIDTSDLQQLVEDLKSQEASYAKMMLEQVAGDEETTTTQVEERQIDAFLTATSTIEELKEMPAVLLGRIPDPVETTIAILHQTGMEMQSLQGDASGAVERYETMQTEVRRDLGDSIQKAFQNVDDILEDLGLETTANNERAVRILAYNQMSITQENIETMKTGDALVQRTFQNMTPAVVAKMIQNQENPLELSLVELNERAEELQVEMASSQEKNGIVKHQNEEKYSEFLWKLDQMGTLSEEERTSFLGVFRLIHQVNETDGAAIGMLLQQGQDVTLKNLLTAVRSRKNERREVTIDDSFGFQTEFHRESLTITQQIELGFTKQQMETMEEQVSPYKLQQFDGEETYMEMPVAELAETLTALDDPEDWEDTYMQEQLTEMRQWVQAEEQVYSILDSFDLPKSPANLAAMQEMLQDRNKVFQTLTEAARNRKVDQRVRDQVFSVSLEDVIQETIEEFGEACKTPEEMAEAQEKLADTAENVMRNALLDDGLASIDLKAMQRMNSQINIFTEMAQAETYHIPIMVADQAGNMTLKIVRGVEKKGLVDVALDMNALGRIRAAFESDGETVEGTINCESETARQMLAEHAGFFAQEMQSATGMGVSFQFGWTRSLDLTEIYQDSKMQENRDDKEEKDAEENRKVQTRTLYGVARAFLQTFEEIVA